MSSFFLRWFFCRRHTHHTSYCQPFGNYWTEVYGGVETTSKVDVPIFSHPILATSLRRTTAQLFSSPSPTDFHHGIPSWIFSKAPFDALGLHILPILHHRGFDLTTQLSNSVSVAIPGEEFCYCVRPSKSTRSLKPFFDNHSFLPRGRGVL